MTRLVTETLRVAGGQRVEGAPPHVAVLPPPLRPARGREEQVFLLLMELGDDAPSSLCREVREVAGQAFWSTPGSVTAALRHAVAAANRLLFETNLQASPEERRYGALTCAAVRGEEVFLAQGGPAWACTLVGGLFDHYPREELPTLGSAAYAEVRLSYVTMQAGDTLLLGSQWLGRSISIDAFRRALSLETAAVLLDALEQVASGGDFCALLVRWPAGEPTPRAEPAVTGEPVPRRRPPRPAPPPAEAPEVPARPRPERRAPRRPAGEGLRRVGRGLAGIAAGAAGAVVRAVRGFGPGVRRAARAAGEGLRTLFRRMLPGPDGRARPRRERRPPPPENPRVMAGLALAILAGVVLVTILAWLSYGTSLRQAQALEQARRDAAAAQSATDPLEVRRSWEAVLAGLQGIRGDPEATVLREEAEAALDVLNRVVWVEPTLLWEFGAEAETCCLAVRGRSVYVLDTATDSVYELTLSEDTGQVLDEGGVPIPIRRGEEIDGQPVGELLDLVWAAPAGERTVEALLVLEQNGSLVVHDPAWGLSRITLAGLPEAAAPVAIDTYLGRLYVLDPQTNQIYRYVPEDGGYPTSPESYFTAAEERSLEGARDLAIDGNVYILLADGAVGKYFEREQVPFDLTGVPDPAPAFVSLVLDAEWTDGPLILADGANDRLVIAAADGTFSGQLRALDDAFRSLQALALDSVRDELFVLAGGRLYVLPLSAIP